MSAGVLFDLDGTLVDSLADIGHALNDVLAAAGHPTHALAAYRGFVGEGAEVLVRRALPPALAGDDAAVRATLDGYKQRYAARLLETTRPYPGVLEVVAALRARGVALGVLSNKPDEPTRRLCAALFPAGTFAAVQGQLAGVPRKPDPSAALALADRLGVAPRDVAFVGDTGVDMATARRAGMRAVGVAWGFRPDELRAAGADAVVDTPARLLEQLEQLERR
jgi:phosphoglycolate phosphatase